MRSIFSYSSLYLALPLWFATAAVLAIFNVPQNYFPWLIFFPAVSLLAVLLDFLLMEAKRKPRSLSSTLLIELRTPKNRVANQLAQALGVAILIFCFLDLAVNGIMILNPGNYTDLSSTGVHIRHISNMCWIFVPLSFFAFRSKKMQRCLLIAAVVFPILFVDRNRLIQSVFCIVLLNLCMSPTRRILSIKVVGIALLLLSVFVTIGFMRSGIESFVVESSGYLLLENQYPLKEWFLKIPIAAQQVLLYISSPLFNFATVGVEGYLDTSVLLAQLFSFLGYFQSTSVPPLLVLRFNVGTEFFPFLQFGGIFPVLLAFLGMFVAVLTSHIMLLSRPNIFFLLIYLRVAYCCVMSGFAPQFYTWTNFDFLLMCVILYAIAPAFRSPSSIPRRAE